MKSAVVVGFVAIVICWASAAFAVPSYRIVKLGFDDAEHTLSGNRHKSDFYGLNDCGQVIGTSDRLAGNKSAWLYDGTATFNIGYNDSTPITLTESGQVIGRSGNSLWVHKDMTTREIGLTGPDYTDPDGNRYSGTWGITEAGQVVGVSTRYPPNQGNYTVPWFYDGVNTIIIGLRGQEHTDSTGANRSYISAFNSAGYVAGHSARYNGGFPFLGDSAWIYKGGSTYNIGLTGSNYTRNDGRKVSQVDALNEAGLVAGHSLSFNGTVATGIQSWIYDGVNTVPIGPSDSEHTRSDGYKLNTPRLINEAGVVVGHADRYGGGSSLIGQSAWLYNGANTISIGLNDSEHVSIFDKNTKAQFLNEAGHVAGSAMRTNSGGGESAWVYNGVTSVRVGLTGIEHTGAGGYKFSAPTQLNEQGQVIGYSKRKPSYTNGDLGRSAWVYDGVSTTQLGFTNAAYTRNDGYKYSEAQKMNEKGQVVGYSTRYIGDNEQGRDAWLYDPVLKTTFSMQLSVLNGYAYSEIWHLGDDGLVLGSYQLSADYSSTRAFYFTTADGLHDLGSLIEGGLTANGWDWLATALSANRQGQIVGKGNFAQSSGDQNLLFMLTPVTSSPGDFNGDGAVDAADYTLWRNHLGSSFDLSGNGDESGPSAGIVDTADYELWKSYFGQSAGTGSSAGLDSANIAVPEPSALSLAALFALAGRPRKRLSTGV